MTNSKIALLLLLFFVFVRNISFGQKVDLLPMPQSVQLNGSFLEYDSWRQVSVSYPSIKKESTNARRQLEAMLMGRRVTWDDKKNSNFIFMLSDDSDTSLLDHPEAYTIELTKDRIFVSARSENGLFYAIQTLKQLFDRSINDRIPLGTIKDYPMLPNRGLMDDISRGPLPNLEYAKEQIRRLSSLKYNIFTFYIEHVVKTDKNGSFAPADGLTINEIEELSAYARLHNMQLVGSFQSLGHFEKILQFPQYRELGSTSRMLKPGDSAAVGFVSQILNEMAPAFGSDYFNLNGDEAWDLDRAAEEDPSGLSPGQLYLLHMKPLLQNLIEKGIRPMMWGDILMHHPEIIEQLPRETIVLTWDYSDRSSFADWIDPFADIEFDFWVCPGVLNSNRFFPNFEQAFGNISGFVKEGIENGADGMLLTVWDDGGRHFFSRDWVGAAYGAEQSWNSSSTVIDSFQERFSSIFYGDTTNIFGHMLKTMALLKDSPAMPNLNNGSFVKDIFPGKDQEVSFSSKDWGKIQSTAIEALEKAEKLKLSVKRNRTDIDFWLFTIKQIELLAKSRLSMIELSKQYEKHCRRQVMEPEEVNKSLDEISDNLSALEAEWEAIFAEFKDLWLVENRSYWTEEANAPYKRHLKQLKDLKARIEAASDGFDPSKAIYLPAPAKVGMTVSDISAPYFTYWLITGPFSIADYASDVKIDFLSEAGGETTVRPIPGQLFQSKDGHTMRWDKVASNYNDRVVLGEIFEDNTKVVAYAYSQIKTAKAMEVQARMGSNDGLTVFLNGKEIFRQNSKRNLIKGENTVTLSLEEGTNHILLKSDQWKGRWEFSFGLEGVNWTSHKHKYTLE